MIKTKIVPVSGGKDSQVCLSLALKAGGPIRVVHQNTGFDHPLTYAQLKRTAKFYKVKIEHTINEFGGMFGFLKRAGYFPNSAARGCTQRLKQEPFARWMLANNFTVDNCEIWFGMRSDESAERSNKYGDIGPGDTFHLSDVSAFYGNGWRKTLGLIECRLPVVAYSTEQIFKYLADEGSPVNGLYARGHHRVGCYPCLLARKSEWVAASRDATGRAHLGALVDLQEQWQRDGNPRKFIKVHRVWDVRKFLQDAADELPELKKDECGYCSI